MIIQKEIILLFDCQNLLKVSPINLNVNEEVL